MTAFSEHSAGWPRNTASTLKYSALDGISLSVMLGAGESYLVAFGILLKATAMQVGILSSLPLLISALTQTFGVRLMEYFGTRRPILVITALFQSLVWIPILAVGQLCGPGSHTVNFLILVASAYFMAGGIAAPVWNSLMGDVVPTDTRGRYFADRTRKCDLSLFAAMVCAGQLLQFAEDSHDSMRGFMVIFSIAAIFRLTSGWWFHLHDDPPFKLAEKGGRLGFVEFLMGRRHPDFVTFVLFAGIMNFAVSFAAPYCSLYMLSDLKLGYLKFTLINAVSVVAQALVLKRWGSISDAFGNKKIMNLCGYGLALNSLLWVFGSQTWYIVFVQFVSGVIQAGFNLATSNYVFDAVSREERGRCVAYQAIINGSCALTGSLAGGFVAGHMPSVLSGFSYFSGASGVFLFIFLVSALLRFMAAHFFLSRFSEVRQVEAVRHRAIVLRVLNPLPAPLMARIVRQPDRAGINQGL